MLWVEYTYGKDLAERLRDSVGSSPYAAHRRPDSSHPRPGGVTALGVKHYVCGSLASVFYGTSRSTTDVDLVAELDAAKVSAVCRGAPGTILRR